MGNIMVEAYAPENNETYMNSSQLEYFRKKLISQKSELVRKSKEHMEKIRNQRSNYADILDRSNFLMTLESDISSYERYSEQIVAIDKALERIDKGRFGYCEITGNEIGIERLEVLPFTHISIEAMSCL
jgi:DnaK suppressor protein